ncbi:MAG TPA: hypothetical protein VF603_05475 [Allosphingosinicella sp.]|jgi:hypothetical protein
MGSSPPSEPDEPDLRLGGFSLWIRHRQFPDAADYWDGNWLEARAVMEAPGARVEIHGPFIHASEITAFAQELSRLDETLQGEARLGRIEPHLEVVMRIDGLGHLAVIVDITPDPFSQAHRFEFALDQTYLAPLRAACGTILDCFPVRGAEHL